jgi:hypothetical protein
LTLFSLDTRTESYWYFVQLQKYDFRHLYHVFSLTPFSLHVIVFSIPCSTSFVFVQFYLLCRFALIMYRLNAFSVMQFEVHNLFSRSLRCDDFFDPVASHVHCIL